MGLFDNIEFKIPEKKKKEDSSSKIKLKNGQTISSLIETANQLVEEKLKNYKDVSKCITNLEDLKLFFNTTEDNAIIAVDTETTGLSFYQDEIVGMSLCNGKDSLYIPINHKSSIYKTKLKNQIPQEDLKNYLKEIIKNRTFRYVFHNWKFDSGVFRTFLGTNWPAPYWDTMICSQCLNQNEDHNLKYLFNTYIAEEDEGVNRFDSLFRRNNI